RRGAAHPAPAVDQHQHALRRQVAQIDFTRAGADAAAVRREAEVTAGVVRTVDGGAGDRQSLQVIGNRDLAAAIDIRGRCSLHGSSGLDRALPDARASDDHLFRLLLSGEGGLYTCGRDQTRRGEQGVAILTGQGTKRSYVHNDLPREGADASTRYCKYASGIRRLLKLIRTFDAWTQREIHCLAQRRPTHSRAYSAAGTLGAARASCPR